MPDQRDRLLWRRKQIIRFAYQLFLTLVFLTSVYVLFGSWYDRPLIQIVLYPRDEWHMFIAVLRRFVLFWAIVVAFFTIVFYATSFAVTPLSFVLGPVQQFLVPLEYEAKRRDPDGPEIDAQAADDTNHEEQGTRGRTAIAGITRGGPRDEAVYRVLRTSARSAANLADKMERKINTHLILGVSMGFLGLAVWYYSFFLGQHPSGTIQNWDRVWEFLPRVTILVFIELLAGFFLRQYRIGVEDFKYFLELRRRADASQIAYTVFDLIQDDKLKLKFATGLLEERSDSHLKKGETTTILEAMKSEENMTLKLVSVLGDHLENVTKLLHKGKDRS